MSRNSLVQHNGLDFRSQPRLFIFIFFTAAVFFVTIIFFFLSLLAGYPPERTALRVLKEKNCSRHKLLTTSSKFIPAFPSSHFNISRSSSEFFPEFDSELIEITRDGAGVSELNEMTSCDVLCELGGSKSYFVESYYVKIDKKRKNYLLKQGLKFSLLHAQIQTKC